MPSTDVASIEILDRSEDLLERVYDSEDDATRDPRGHYTEFEQEANAKPWKPMDIAELIEAGLVTDHAESDTIPSVDEIKQAIEYDSIEDQEWGGTAFLTLTKLGEQYIQENGLGEE